MTILLPEYTKQELQTYDCDQLLKIMIVDEDRVPRLLIDECVDRGLPMLEALSGFLKKKPHQETDGEWWLKLHMIMIIGLMSSEQAGIILIECIEAMRTNDDDLEEWFSGHWPAITKNKPTKIIEKIKTQCNDKTTPWFLRTNLTDVVIERALTKGKDELEEALDWIANLVANKDEDWDFRLTAANSLIDFPRDRHLKLLSDLAKQQTGFGVHFNQKDINRAYQIGKDTPAWERLQNLWDFYDPKQIEQRQQRWLKEDSLSKKTTTNIKKDDYNYQQLLPFKHDIPKVGRNDSCPCGSGKKYKKCCLN